jgi:MFS family permease
MPCGPSTLALLLLLLLALCTHLLRLAFLAAVGFISRPVGALLFGHMGDTRGRGLCLLISVILMGVPTVRCETVLMSQVAVGPFGLELAAAAGHRAAVLHSSRVQLCSCSCCA